MRYLDSQNHRDRKSGACQGLRVKENEESLKGYKVFFVEDKKGSGNGWW